MILNYDEGCLNSLTRLEEDYGLQARVLRVIHSQRGALRQEFPQPPRFVHESFPSLQRQVHGHQGSFVHGEVPLRGRQHEQFAPRLFQKDSLVSVRELARGREDNGMIIIIIIIFLIFYIY